MRINSGIVIYFVDDDSKDIPSLGITDGVGRYLESDVPELTIANYRSDLLLPGWNSGWGDRFDLRTHVRPQIIDDVTIKMSNVSGFYEALLSNNLSLEGSRVSFVDYTDPPQGDISIAPPYYVKDVSKTATQINITLSNILDQQNIDISKPISGDIWYPVVVGNHDYGVFVSNAGGFEPVTENHSWGMLTQGTGSEESNQIRTGIQGLLFVAEDTSIPVSTYINESFDGMYFRCTSGNGSGKSVKCEKFTDGINRVSTDTLNSVYTDTSGKMLFSGYGGGIGMSDATSAGEMVKYLTNFSTDIYSGIGTSNRIFNKDKIPVSSEALIVSGSTIDISAPTITDDKIEGYPLFDFETIAYNDNRAPDFIMASEEQAWTYKGNGVWVGSNAPIQNTPDTVTLTGNIANIIDANSATSHNVNLHYNDEAGGTYANNLQLAVQSFYINRPEDFEILLSDLEIRLTMGDDLGTTDRNIYADAAVHVHAYWQSEAGWTSVVDPVSIMEFRSLTQSNPVALNDQYLYFRSFIPQYYGETGTNVNFDVNYVQGAYSGFDPANIYMRGSENFTLNDGAFDSRGKKPTGYIVSISIKYTMTWGQSAGEVNGYADLDFNLKSFAGYRSKTSVDLSDFVLAKVIGRPYTTFQAYQTHISKLLNWSLDFRTRPSVGWGLAECTDASVINSAANTTPVRSQWADKKYLNTKQQLEQIQLESWNVMVNLNSEKRWYSFLDKLGVEDPSYSFTAPSEISKIDAVPFDEINIYNTFVVNYDYDIATNTYNKSISVTQVAQPSYSAEYVTGVTNPVDAGNIWTRAKVLYDVTKSERNLPDNLSNLRNIYTEEAALQYIRNFIDYGGVNTANVYLPNWTTKTVHPIKDVYTLMPMTTIGYTSQGLWDGVEATGVVIGRKYITGEPKQVEITAIVKPTKQIIRIIEQDGNPDRIIEQDGNPDRIIEEQ